MSDIRRQDEPSMEEILASIRRIIAEDNKDGGTPSAAEQDILELTDRVEADGSVVSLATRMAPRAETREPPPIAVAPYEPAAKTAPEPELTAAKPAASDSVISAGTAAASIAALSALTRETSRGSGSAISGDRVLEEATRELLKPLLKAWLDTNLPPLIERIVREEIARLAREADGG